MRRLALVVLLTFSPWIVSAGIAGSVSWSIPVQYTDGSAIAAADQARIVCTVYQAADNTAAGTVFGTGAPGATSVLGTTVRGRYYYATAALDGQVSAPSPRFLFPFLAPGAPGALQVAP